MDSSNPFFDLLPQQEEEEANPFADLMAAQKSRTYSYSEIPGAALENLPKNAAEVGGALWEAAKHPIETAKNIGKLGIGMVEEMIPGQSPDSYETTHADPFYRHLFDDYGSIEAAKRTLAEKPVQALLDATIVTPGGPIGAVGRASKAATYLPRKATKYVFGETTGLGPRALGEAYESGVAGGERGAAFRGNMRGNVDPETVVTQARGAVTELRKDRGAEYRAGMEGVKANQTVLDFAPVDATLQSVAGIKRFKGVSINDKTADISKEIMDKVNEWKALDPKEYHTPEGFDALKQSLGDIRDATQPHTPARRVADAAYHGVKEQIVRQAPEYAKTMHAYEKASHTIDELTRSLVGGEKTTIDTSLRKLQSVLRNNAFANYSQRAKLAAEVEKKVPNLISQLAGQSANSFAPRGLPAKMLLGGGGLVSILVNGIMNPASLVGIGAALTASSPRIVAEGAHLAGRAVGGASRGGRAIPARGTAVISRDSSLQLAGDVLSPKVLEHMKRAAPRELNAWLKDRRPESTKAFAEAVAAAVKRPDLVEKIIQELSN
jgi:hypothetical protein